MKKLQARIMTMNFGKATKRFVIAALLIVILGGIVVGVAYRTQINELISYHQTYDGGSDRATQEMQPGSNDKSVQYNDGEQGETHDHERGGFLDSAQITEPTTGAKIVLGLYGLLCMLIGAAYWLLIASWLYQAAEKSAMNGLLWAVLGIIFNLAAALAFLLLRSRKATCHSCGYHQNQAMFCRACGAAMQIKCTECGTVADARDIYCSHCGKILKHDAPSETK